MKLKTFEDFIIYQNILSDRSQEKLLKIGKPKRLAFVKVPENLNEITLGQLITLWQIKTDADLLYLSADAVLADFGDGWIAKAKERIFDKALHYVSAYKAIGWANFIASELMRINEMWKQCNVPLTDIDRKAGAESLNFGFFSIIDTYAQRQGYKDHDDVLKVKWIKVWQSLAKDAAVARFKIRKTKLTEKEYENRR